MTESAIESSAEVVGVVEEVPIRVLHVDDEAGFLKAAKQILEMQGAFQVETAGSVEEAMEKMKQKTYDVVVSDYVMPGKNGLEFLKELRKSGNKIPFIIFTGKSREEVAVRALNLGADRYFNKIGQPETVYGELAHGLRRAVKERKSHIEVWRREERLRAILASSPDAVIISDLDGNVVGCNQATLKLTRRASKEEIIGKNSLEFIAEKDRNRASENLKKVLEQETVRNIEYTLLKKDREEYIGELSASILKDFSGNPVGFVGVVRDITERKKAEEEIEAGRRRLRDIIDAMADSVCITDMDSNITMVNKALEDLFEMPREKLLTMKGFDLTTKEDEAKVSKAIQDLFKTGLPQNVQVTGGLGGAKDRPFWIRMSLLKGEKGEPTEIVTITRDITERKRAEEELRMKEATISASQNAIGITDLAGNLIYVNDSFLWLYGYDDQSEVLGKPGASFWTPVEEAQKAIMELRKNGKWYGELLAQKKDGSVANVLLSASVVTDETGKPSWMMASGIDITKRKKAEEVIQESEERYRKLFDGSSDGLVIVDREDGSILDCNQEFMRQTGRDRKQLLNMKIWGIRPPQLREAARKKFLEVKGFGGSVELDFQKPSGEIIEIDFMSRAANIGGRKVLQSRCRDITERKRREEALSASEARYRTMIELAPDGIITVDIKGVVTSVNNAFSRLTGYSQDEVVGMHFTKLGTLRAIDIPQYLKLMSSVMRGKIPPPFEYSYIRKNGTIGWGEAQVGLMKRDGKITGFQVLLRETTRRKMAEKATQESEEKFERLFTNSPEAAVYVDSKFHVLDVNPRFEELFGYSLNEIMGKHIDDVVVSKDKTKEAAMLDKKATKGPIYQDTVRKKRDGTLVSVSISAAPITVEGNPVGYVAMYRDISQLKRTEKQLQEALEKLSVVGELTRHDARNKLSSVAMNMFLAKQKLPDDHEGLQHLREVESTVRQIERIFEFARIYEKLGLEELIYIDAEKSLNEASKLFSDIQGIMVVNDCQGLTVLADSLLRQLLYNLIDNSLKHGEKVSQVKVYYEVGKDSLKLVYEDDGVGIPKAEKEKIFREGYGKGTGYGLYLIKKMCDVYGWTIRETGKHGGGARFTITMPKMHKEGKEGYRLR